LAAEAGIGSRLYRVAVGRGAESELCAGRYTVVNRDYAARDCLLFNVNPVFVGGRNRADGPGNLIYLRAPAAGISIDLGVRQIRCATAGSDSRWATNKGSYSTPTATVVGQLLLSSFGASFSVFSMDWIGHNIPPLGAAVAAAHDQGNLSPKAA
jgi:hypothetical protein